VRVEREHGEDAEHHSAPWRRPVEVLHRGRQPGEHHRKAENEWQEAEAEHNVHDEGHDEERQAFVPPERTQKGAHRERRASEVETHHRDARGFHAEDERQRVADEIVEEVLRMDEVQPVDVREPEGGIGLVVDEPQRRNVEGKILERRVLDDPRRGRGQDGQRGVEERSRLYGHRGKSHAGELTRIEPC
jgi:hypothetical protein